MISFQFKLILYSPYLGRRFLRGCCKSQCHWRFYICSSLRNSFRVIRRWIRPYYRSWSLGRLKQWDSHLYDLLQNPRSPAEEHVPKKISEKTANFKKQKCSSYGSDFVGKILRTKFCGMWVVTGSGCPP